MDQKVQELKDKITALKDELRQHSQTVEDKRCAALCETAAEVEEGLEKAFTHFLEKSEPAWQDQTQSSGASPEAMGTRQDDL